MKQRGPDRDPVFGLGGEVALARVEGRVAKEPQPVRLDRQGNALGEVFREELGRLQRGLLRLGRLSGPYQNGAARARGSQARAAPRA